MVLSLRFDIACLYNMKQELQEILHITLETDYYSIIIIIEYET